VCYLIANRRRILQECLELCVLAQRVPKRREAKTGRVTSVWDLKQVRKGGNRRSDIAAARLNLCEVSFGDWFEVGVAIEIGHCLARLFEAIWARTLPACR
jgi:hypothetical protein